MTAPVDPTRDLVDRVEHVLGVAAVLARLSPATAQTVFLDAPVRLMLTLVEQATVIARVEHLTGRPVALGAAVGVDQLRRLQPPVDVVQFTEDRARLLRDFCRPAPPRQSSPKRRRR